MRGNRGRHPFFEGLVFGLAFLLFLIIGWHSLKGFFPSQAGRALASKGKVPSYLVPPAPGTERRELVSHGMERASEALVPIQVTKAGGVKRKTVVPLAN